MVRQMEFKKEDENYIYNVIGKNVKKYRKMKKLTQAQLAEQIDYSLSFISSLESKKYQTFSLGALWRISLILGVDMYKLCIDEDVDNKEYIVNYKCDKCDYNTDIPSELLNMSNIAKNIYPSAKKDKATFKCPKCDGKMFPNDINNF